MISEILIKQLDEMIGDYDTPFFRYLVYSYGFSVNDCELIIDEFKSDIENNRLIPDNIVSALQDYFRAYAVRLEKRDKIAYLESLIRRDSEFFIKYLERYGLSDGEIEVVFSRVKSRICEGNITEFEIKRYLEYYFENTVRQEKYISELNKIRGRNYDTLIIRSVRKKYPVLLKSDFSQIISDIREDILDAGDFSNGIRHEFETRCMKKSERKKADARSRLENLVEGNGDSFNKLVKFKRLTREEGRTMVSQILEDIKMGRIQPESVNGSLLTKRCNEFKK